MSASSSGLVDQDPVEALIAYCTRADTFGLLESGLEVVGTKTGVHVGAIVTYNNCDAASFFGARARVTLKVLQQIKYNLSKKFDLPADEWHASPVCRMLDEIQREIFLEVAELEKHARGESAKYNIQSIRLLHYATLQFCIFIARRRYQLLGVKLQLWLFNRYADTFMVGNKNRKTRQLLILNAQVVLAVQYMRQNYTTRDISEMISFDYATDLLHNLKVCFGDL